MAEVDTSIYRPQAGGPLGQAQGALNLLNTIQQNQLLNTATQQRQLELQQGFSNDLRSTLAPLANRPDVTQAEVKAAIAHRARQLGPGGQQIYDALSSRYSGQDWKKNLTVDAIGSVGPEGAIRRMDIVNPDTGATASVPAVAGVGINAISTSIPQGAGKSAEAFYNDQAREAQFPGEMVPWQKARELLQKLPSGSTGPGSAGRQQLEEFVWALSPTVARWAGVSPDKIKDWGQLQKYLTQATLGQANNLGGNGTDMRLAQAITGNPHVQINDLTNRQVVDMAIAVRRMEHAQVAGASRAGQVGYIPEKNRLTANLDPRAFMIDLMPPDQIEKLKTTLKGKEREKFNRSLQLGIQSQVITPPGQ